MKKQLKLAFAIMSSLLLLAVFSARTPDTIWAGGPGGGWQPPLGGGKSSSHGTPVSGKSGSPGIQSGKGKNPANNGGEQQNQIAGASGKKTVADMLAQKPQLSSKIQTLLAPGANLQEACSGFEHLGQFVATAHAAKNLAIPFDALKGMLTTSSGRSLGQAIHELKPDIDAREATIKANELALRDLEATLQR